jgi:hypothetical protein
MEAGSMRNFDIPFPLFVVLCIGFVVGAWSDAHEAVATECKKLGSFYVGSKVYECKEKP